MDFDTKTIEMFIPKDQTLFQAIRSDYQLHKRTLHFTKKYRRAFPQLSLATCLAKGQKLAYAEYITKVALKENLIPAS